MGFYTRGSTCSIAVLALVLGYTGNPVVAQVAHGNKARLDLLASVTAATPGTPFDVGIRFLLEPGWHIYWINSGESGLPPKVDWVLPAGFSAGDLRFPVPERRLDASGTVLTNVLEKDPVLLTEMRPGADIGSPSVTLRAEVAYLICREKCLRETAAVTLSLPMASAGSTVGNANVEVFERARKALPPSQSESVSVTPAISAETIREGDAVDVLLAVDVAEGYFLEESAEVTDESRKLDAFIKPVPGLYFDRPVFPPPDLSAGDAHGPGYSGRVVIRIPADADQDLDVGRLALGGVVTYVPCTSDGRCLGAKAVAFSSFGADANGRPELEVVARETSPPRNSGSDGAATPGWVRYLGLLFGCYLYGLFINATPCVLPILSIKVLGFVQQAHESRHRTAILGLAFGAGVMVFFVVLGLLASRGTNVLQYPAAVIALGTIVMALALSMLGVYTLQAPSAANELDARIRQEGTFASFGKGALAPVLGFACTGPLLAGAFGWATQQPAHLAILAFLLAGLGMASPYMLLGANPKWLGFLPRPGPWMITFERIMGFLLLGMVIWLLHPLVFQIGAVGLEWTIVFMIAVALACWVLGKVEITMPSAIKWRYRGAAGATILLAGVLIYGWIYPLNQAIAHQKEQRTASVANPEDWSSGVPWRQWSPEAVERAVRAGNIAFVDFTAAWCTVCKTNKALATNSPQARARMKALGVVPFQADLTTENHEASAEMRRHDRAGPPLNLIYPPGRPDDPMVLRPNLTLDYFLGKLDEAAATRTATAG